MHYTVYNEQASEHTFIALPALGERKEVYALLADRLPQYKIISFDLPGHNGYQPNDYTIRGFTNHLCKQLKELGLEKAHFIGNSIGAWIIQDYYKTYPDDVASLWLLDGGHFFEEKKETGKIELPVIERLEDLSEAIEALANELSNPADIQFFKDYLRKNFTFENQVYKHHANKRIVNGLAKELETTNFCADTFTVPTLLFVSEENCTHDEFRVWVSSWEEKHNLKSIMIHNSTHLLPLTNSSEVAALIQKHIS